MEQLNITSQSVLLTQAVLEAEAEKTNEAKY